MNLAEYDLNYRIATEDEFYEIKHFLKRNNTYSANRNDTIYLVRYREKIIGLARLLKVEGATNTLWLRGLYINNKWRSKGIASELLSKIYKELQRQDKIKHIYAFAEKHLEHFYKHNAYQEIHKDLLPISLKQKFENAQQQGKKWLCLPSRAIF